MVKKLMVSALAVGLLIGNVQAKSLSDVLRRHNQGPLEELHDRVEGLLLTRSDITEISEEEGQLLATNYPFLSILELNHNNLTKLPSSFGQLKRLRKLSIGSNNLTELPSSFGQLKELTTLYLNNNKLRELPSSFGQLKDLVTLNISDNELSSFPKALIALPILTSLSIRGNDLVTLPEEIKDMWLRDLDLTFNKLSQHETDLVRSRLPRTRISGLDKQRQQKVAAMRRVRGPGRRLANRA